jgi:ABC-2 type transport system permease protein
MLRALGVEISKLARQRLVWVSLGLVLLVVALFCWGMARFDYTAQLRRAFGPSVVVGGDPRSAALLAYSLLRLPLAGQMLLPLLVAVVTGGLLAGERAQGTLRVLLVRPVSRLGLLAAKLAAAWLWAVLLALCLGVAGWALGHLFFGSGQLITIMDRQPAFLSSAEASVRLAAGYGLTALSLIAVASVGLCLSCFTDNPLTATGLTVGLLMISGLVGVMPWFESWRPFLLTTHLDLSQGIFANPVSVGEIRESLLYLGAYTLVSVLITGVIFNYRDVRS